ncbi:MAG: hypothetical protein JJU18_00010 [Oceanicaulis sp.]|nr:hypothetical protein [Oceanicaulis sp.]
MISAPHVNRPNEAVISASDQTKKGDKTLFRRGLHAEYELPSEAERLSIMKRFVSVRKRKTLKSGFRSAR